MSGESTTANSTTLNAFSATALLVARIILYLFLITTFVILGYICSVAVEWIGMKFIWQEQGVQHSQRMYEIEYSYINEELANGLFRGGTLDVVERAVAWSYELVTPASDGYVSYYLSFLKQPVRSSDWMVVDTLKTALAASSDYFYAARNIAKVYTLRLTVIVLSLPLFIIILHAATVDGLTQRERRKAGGGVESGFVYHLMKKWRSIALIFPLVIYLSFPVSIHPNYALLPMALVLWFLNYVYIVKFKKNL